MHSFGIEKETSPSKTVSYQSYPSEFRLHEERALYPIFSAQGTRLRVDNPHFETILGTHCSVLYIRGRRVYISFSTQIKACAENGCRGGRFKYLEYSWGDSKSAGLSVESPGTSKTAPSHKKAQTEKLTGKPECLGPKFFCCFKGAASRM